MLYSRYLMSILEVQHVVQTEKNTSCLKTNYSLWFCLHGLIVILLKKKPQVIWPKISKVFYFRKPLPKSKQRGWVEQRENRSYDTLIFNLCDPLSVVEISFVEKTAKKFNGFLVTFKTSAQHINSVS